jgi:hypothetical protein
MILHKKENDMIRSISILLLLTNVSFAQINLPEWSPESTIHQPVGYATFDIRYGRPAARERKIMDGLVPYKKLWRTGAGKCTTISFNQNITINNKNILAGIYSIATIPDEKEWTIMLNSDTSKIYGDPGEYNINTEVLRFKVASEKSGRFYESLTIDLDIKGGDAVFYLAWENTQIHFPIATGSHQKAMEEIKTSLAKNYNDVDMLAMASWYYDMNNESGDQALQWLNRALSIKEDRWVYAQKIDILEKKKKFNEARKTIEAATAFLELTKPDEWENSVKGYKTRMKSWPTN